MSREGEVPVDGGQQPPQDIGRWWKLVAAKSAVPRELMEELVEAMKWGAGEGLLMVECTDS